MQRPKKKNHPHYFQHKVPPQDFDAHSNPFAGPCKFEFEIYNNLPDADPNPVPGPHSCT